MELVKAKGNAISFPDSRPPEESIEIGRENRAGTVFVYFKGIQTGTYYFGTERGMAFARKMEEIQKKRKAPAY